MCASEKLRRKRLEYQGYHLAAFVLLGALQYLAIGGLYPISGSLWGLSTLQWTMLAWLFAGLFQFWVAFFWRMELYGKAISSRLGRNGFTLHQIGYGVLGAVRFGLLIPICLSSRGSLPIPPWVAIVLIAVTTPPILWAIYSAARYFGFRRAAGADHFLPAYREAGFERKGMYKHVPNVMYSVAVLGIHHAGLLWLSAPGLIASAAHHAFVWTHYFCTEKPDIRKIYEKHAGSKAR